MTSRLQQKYSQAVDFHLEVSRFFHRELTHLLIIVRGLLFGQDIGVFLSFTHGGFGTCLESETVISGFENVAAMCKAIEQCCCHFCVAKNRSPFTEAEICGDDDAGALVKLAQQMKEQRAA